MACRLIVPFSLWRGGGRLILAFVDRPKAHPDPVLIKALRAAHKMVNVDADGMPVLTTSPDSPYLRKLVRLAFLSPDLQRAILEGHQPQGLRIEHLMRSPMSLGWSRQAERIQTLSR